MRIAPGRLPELASAIRKFHILHMVTTVKRTGRTRSSTSSEGTVVYRGIKIAPLSGKRSATAQAILDALRTKSEQLRVANRRAAKPLASKAVFINLI